MHGETLRAVYDPLLKGIFAEACAAVLAAAWAGAVTERDGTVTLSPYPS
ncbi:hypothetical protein J2T20_004557 [Paenibacillus wynnii]|nr:hypothetical protein [Paenibacillus wynnii]